MHATPELEYNIGDKYVPLTNQHPLTPPLVSSILLAEEALEAPAKRTPQLVPTPGSSLYESNGSCERRLLQFDSTRGKNKTPSLAE